MVGMEDEPQKACQELEDGPCAQLTHLFHALYRTGKRDSGGLNPFRDEFELNAENTRADVMRWWEEGWAQVFVTIEALKPEDVMRTVTIRGEPYTVLQAINRQIAHYAQHTGQIVFLAKHLRSGEWKTLSIPRGKSEEFKIAAPKPHKPMS